jgi:hypothetical protein
MADGKETNLVSDYLEDQNMGENKDSAITIQPVQKNRTSVLKKKKK